MPEAGVAVQFGLALGALYGALQSPAEEALRERRRLNSVTESPVSE